MTTVVGAEAEAVATSPARRARTDGFEVRPRQRRRRRAASRSRSAPSTPSSRAPTSPRSARRSRPTSSASTTTAASTAVRSQFVLETEATDPAQAAAAAKKLVETDKVLGIVGSTSIIECAVNHQYYEQQRLLRDRLRHRARVLRHVQLRGRQHGTAPQRHGRHAVPDPRGRREAGADPVEGAGHGVHRGRLPRARRRRRASRPRASPRPCRSRTRTRSRSRSSRRPAMGGGVVLNFTPPEALKILQAAAQQGLQDRVKWACSTPCNTDFLADALGAAFDDKLGVNAELNLVNDRRAGHKPLQAGAEGLRAGHPAGQLQPDRLPRGRGSRPRR